MYEYKVVTYKVPINNNFKLAENAMNELAKEGWRVIAVSHNVNMGLNLIVTYEHKID